MLNLKFYFQELNKALTLLYKQRHAITVLVLRDIKGEFTHTFLGPLWFIVQPLIQSVIFYYIFGNIGRMPIEGQSRFFFYIFGILAWTTFSQVSLNNSWTLIANRGIITKIKVSPFLFPLANITFRSVQCIVNLTVFFGVYVISHWGALPAYTLATPVSVVFGVFVLSITAGLTGMFAASLSTKKRDLIHLWGYILNATMYISPIIYPVNSLTGWHYTLSSFNPVTLGVELIRSPLITGNYLPMMFFLNSFLSIFVLFLFTSYFYISYYSSSRDTI